MKCAEGDLYMKKRIILTSICFILSLVIFVQYAFAVTETIIIKPNYTEDTVISISFKDGQEPGCAEYIYTGKKIKPEIVVKKVDKTVADPSEYRITYDEDCEKTGMHTVTAEYLKTGYKISMDYLVVPGTTNNIYYCKKRKSDSVMGFRSGSYMLQGL